MPVLPHLAEHSITLNTGIAQSSRASQQSRTAVGTNCRSIGADGRGHMLSRMFMIAGPITTTNSAGKMQNTIGISIFTGAFCARS